MISVTYKLFDLIIADELKEKHKSKHDGYGSYSNIEAKWLKDEEITLTCIDLHRKITVYAEEISQKWEKIMKTKMRS